MVVVMVVAMVMVVHLDGYAGCFDAYFAITVTMTNVVSNSYELFHR